MNTLRIAAALALVGAVQAQTTTTTTIIDDWDCYVYQKDQGGDSLVSGPRRLGGTTSSVTDTAYSRGIPESGSVFEIWAIKPDGTVSPVLIDHQVVGPWPVADVQIRSTDPWVSPAGARRTRVDHPFTVTTTVQGILPPVNPVTGSNPMANPAGAREVHVQRQADRYVGQGPEIAATNQPAVLKFTSNNTDPGHTIVNNATTILPGDNLADATGTETFSAWGVSAGATPGVMNPVVRLDQETIDILPMEALSFGEFDSSQSYQSAPTITFNVSNAYPGSELRFSFFRAGEGYNPADGAPDSTDSIPNAPSLQVAVDATRTRESATLTLDTLRDAFVSDGTYHVVATYSVKDQAGNEIYPSSQVISPPIVIQTNIVVNGSVTSSE